MKKYVLAVATAIALASGPSFAQTESTIDPAAVEATRQMLDAMKLRDVMAASFRQAEQTMPSQMRTMLTNMINSDPKMSAAQKTQALAKLDKELPGMAAAMHDLFADPSLVDEMLAEIVPLYARTYTADEIHQLSAFYQSPVGQKMLATMPKLMSESMAISNRLMTPRIQKLAAQAAKSVVGQ